jgi:tetrahydromethanopterin S-methyltransferase subunit E
MGGAIAASFLVIAVTLLPAVAFPHPFSIHLFAVLYEPGSPVSHSLLYTAM